MTAHRMKNQLGNNGDEVVLVEWIVAMVWIGCRYDFKDGNVDVHDDYRENTRFC